MDLKCIPRYRAARSDVCLCVCFDEKRVTPAIHQARHLATTWDALCCCSWYCLVRACIFLLDYLGTYIGRTPACWVRAVYLGSL